jgi:hypothetical protein
MFGQELYCALFQRRKPLVDRARLQPGERGAAVPLEPGRSLARGAISPREAGVHVLRRCGHACSPLPAYRPEPEPALLRPARGLPA